MQTTKKSFCQKLLKNGLARIIRYLEPLKMFAFELVNDKVFDMDVAGKVILNDPIDLMKLLLYTGIAYFEGKKLNFKQVPMAFN